MENAEIIISLAGTVISLIIAVITFIAKFLKSEKAKTTAENIVQICNEIVPLINQAEQFVNFSGQEKKDVTVTNHKGLLVRSEKDDLITTYTYDSYGNVTSTQITGTDGSVISTQASYSANGESQTSFADERGKTTNYNYVLPHNVLQKLTYPSGGFEQYTYDAFKEKLTGISAKTALGSALLSQTVNLSKNRVSQAVCGNVTYTFTYNNHGDLTRVSAVNGTNQITVFSAGYNRNNNSYIEIVNYDSGYSESKTFDKYGNLVEIHENATCKAALSYADKNNSKNSKSQLKSVADYYAGTNTTYSVSENDPKIFETSGTLNWKKESRLTGFEQSASTVYTFNDASNDVLVYKKHYYGENKNSLYIYDSVSNTSNFFQSTKNTDALKRISQKTFGASASPGVNAEITYGYVTNGTKKTMMISSETAKTNNALTSERTYTYSDNGNIEQINITKPENDYLGSGMTVNTTKTVKYYYDEMNRLTKEENAVTGKTTEFQYDSSNNISKKIVNGTEYSYGYSNGLLTSFHGQSIVYTGGYPTNYRGTPFSWSRNRLKSYTKSGTTYTFTYDAFGRKVKKQAGTNYWLYYYDGDKLIGQDRYTNAGLLYGARYIYDDEGLFGVKVRGGQSSQPNIYQNFYVTKDAYGNIVRMDGAQGKVFEIEYDAWGNQNVIYSTNCGDTDVSAKEFMPFRYRGYYYDDNLGLYYLMSRYYDPETGRFISPDAIEYLDPQTLGGLNLYAYCGNNPVMGYDPSGKIDWNKVFGWLSVVALSAFAMCLIVIPGGMIAAGIMTANNLVASTLVGAGVGIFAGVGGSIEAQGGFSNIGNINPWSVSISGLIGGAIGAVSGAMSYGFSQIGKVVGQQMGFMLSNARHISTGVNIAKVFGLTATTLTKAGYVIGGSFGATAGGIMANTLANSFVEINMGEEYTVNNPNYIRSSLLKLFKWLSLF